MGLGGGHGEEAKVMAQLSQLALVQEILHDPDTRYDPDSGYDPGMDDTAWPAARYETVRFV